VADGHNEIWKTQEENLTRIDKNDQETYQNLARAGLWILKGTSSTPNLYHPQIPISEQIKNHFNSEVFTQEHPNFDSTEGTEELNDRVPLLGAGQTNQASKFKLPENNYKSEKQTPNFGGRITNNLHKPRLHPSLARKKNSASDGGSKHIK
jgi:hypothetical protein